jgi:hypothetical protein
VSDPRDYVPDAWLVRATLDDAVGDERDAWSAFDASDAALAYVPSESLVRNVVARSARPAFRVHLLEMPNATAPRRPSLAGRAAALLGTWGLSPAVLAASVVAHAALAALGAALAVGGAAWPGAAALGTPAVAERVAMVALAPSTVQAMSPGLRRELAVTVGQSIGATPAGGGLSRRDRARLDTTATYLGRFPAARLTLASDSTPRALATAELVQGYLYRRGVARARMPIVPRATGTGRVTVALDTVTAPGR